MEGVYSEMYEVATEVSAPVANPARVLHNMSEVRFVENAAKRAKTKYIAPSAMSIDLLPNLSVIGPATIAPIAATNEM